MNLWVQLLAIIGFAAFAWLIHAPLIAILAGLSAILTFITDSYRRKLMYYRVLDVIDSQIESEWLGKAVEHRLSAAEAHGINVQLPGYISNEYRKKIAEYLRKQSAAGTAKSQVQ